MPVTATAPPPARPQSTSAWDSEVFVLRGDGRALLRERVLGLTAFLDRQGRIGMAHNTPRMAVAWKTATREQVSITLNR